MQIANSDRSAHILEAVYLKPQVAHILMACSLGYSDTYSVAQLSVLEALSGARVH